MRGSFVNSTAPVANATTLVPESARPTSANGVSYHLAVIENSAPPNGFDGFNLRKTVTSGFYGRLARWRLLQPIQQCRIDPYRYCCTSRLKSALFGHCASPMVIFVCLASETPIVRSGMRTSKERPPA